MCKRKHFKENQKRVIANFFFIFLLLTNNTYAGAKSLAICPGKQCPTPCYAIEASDCSCAPRGCDDSKGTGLSIDVADKPFCRGGKLFCTKGVPACRNKNLKPVCGGELFGFRKGFTGPGCVKRYGRSYSYFNKGSVYCKVGGVVSTDSTGCNKKILCDKKNKRKSPCREDRSLCKCVCPFKIKNQKHTPRCDAKDKPKCSKKLLPVCSKSSNVPGCEGGKLFCRDTLTGAIDLKDTIICK